MAKRKGADASSTLRRQYRELMERCKVNLEQIDRELPPAREDFHETLKERGVSRRDFIKWASLTTTALMPPPASAHEVEFPAVLSMAELMDQAPEVVFLCIVPQRCGQMELDMTSLMQERFTDMEALLL